MKKFDRNSTIGERALLPPILILRRSRPTLDNLMMPYRIMCNGVNREGVKASSDLAYRLFFIYHYTNFDMASYIWRSKFVPNLSILTAEIRFGFPCSLYSCSFQIPHGAPAP